MRVLLTGGAGYIGSACLRWLLARGHDAVAYDDLSTGNAASVPPERLVRGDILDVEGLATTLRRQGTEAVIHLAARAIVPESVREPAAYWHANTVGTHCVLEAMRTAGVERFVFSSTAATYDVTAPMPLVEKSPQRPENPYGESKLAAERMICDYAGAYGLRAIILRYFNAAGADADGTHGECRSHETHLIPIVFRAVLGQAERVQVYGGDWDTPDGSCVRDYVHVQDLAEAHRLALDALADGASGIYNVGSGTGTSVLEVIRAVEQVTGSAVQHDIAPRRPGDPAVLVASPDKLIRDLGWSSEFADIRAIAETAWRWHHSHPDGYAAVT